MTRQRLRLDQVYVPPGTPDGHVPTAVSGELVLAAPSGGGGGAAAAATAWTDLPLRAGYVSRAGSFGNTPQYRRIGDLVFLRGTVKLASGGNLPTAATAFADLPSGFRPKPGAGTAAASDGTLEVVTASVQASSTVPTRIDINADGVVKHYMTTAVPWFSLDGVEFETGTGAWGGSEPATTISGGTP